MSEWSITKLGDVLEITNGYAFKSVNFRSEPEAGCLPVLKIKNVANGDVHINDVQYHHFEEKLSKYTAQKGDILISLTGNHPHAETQVVGAVSKLKMDIRAFVNQRVAKIDTKPNLADKDYIYFALKEEGLSKYLASQSSGSANQANISKADIEDLDIALPPLPEQKAIASVLSSLDDKIDLLHRQNKTLEAMAETLFRQWFIEEAKEDWEEVTLGDLCEVITKGTTPKQFAESGVNFIKAESLTDTGSFIRSKFASVSNEIHEGVLKRSILKIDDVLFSIAGTIGRVAKVTEDILPANTNQALAILRPNRGVNSDLIYCILKSAHFQELADGKIVHAVQPNLSLGEISNTCIRLPSESVLKAFTNQVSTYFDKKHTNAKQIQTLEQLRDTLLPKLMSGEVRVQYQTEEVA